MKPSNLVFVFLLNLSILYLFSCQKPILQTPLTKAVNYLWSQQAKDGGWHSPKHGIMKTGQAHTPFILFALLQVPERVFPTSPDKVKNGLIFIRNHIDETGALGFVNPYVMEYPNYATSYALRVFSKSITDSS